MNEPLVLSSITGIPLIKPGIDLSKVIFGALNQNGIRLTNRDVIVVTQKIVSKAENRYVNLIDIDPSKRAMEISETIQKDPRLIELILSESQQVLRMKEGTIIVEHRLGFICANAGIDHSNVKGLYGDPEDWYLLLPKNPDKSAQGIRDDIYGFCGTYVGILIIDSQGRAWRNGTIGTTIGLAGLPGLVDLRGYEDLFGYKLKVTQVAVADELAAAASLIMGQTKEKIPVVHVRGFPYSLRDADLQELLRKKDLDLFR
ncbi:MAG TPA: coenzyme F420-0:L-glutamate ligase [Anaerolineae bacterium]|nr:coenzyme F420-0:L-glutamate ligase [Anaerolineae bacterium]